MLRRTFNKILVLFPLVGVPVGKIKGSVPWPKPKGITVLNDWELEYSPQELFNIFEAAEFRFTKIKSHWTQSGYGLRLEVKFPNKDGWQQICRTDLMDDVCTGRCYYIGDDNNLEKEKEFWVQKAKNSLGGRLRDDGKIAIVDSYSDG